MLVLSVINEIFRSKFKVLILINNTSCKCLSLKPIIPKLKYFGLVASEVGNSVSTFINNIKCKS